MSAHMRTMDNIDAEYLASHPADGTPARITLTEDAPRGTYADGQPSTVIIEATAENYMDLLVALEALNEERPRVQLTAQWVSSMVSPGQMPDLLTAGETEDLLTKVVTTNHSPFLSFSTPAVFEVGQESGKQVSINITVTAPSIFTGMQALKHLTTPRLLESTAMGLRPAREDAAAS